MEPPVARGAVHVFEKAGESGLALFTVEGFIIGIEFILEAPIGGRRGGLLEETAGLGAGNAAGAQESGGGLTGAMAGGDQLGQERMDIITIGIHAIPEQQWEAAQAQGQDKREGRAKAATWRAPKVTSSERHRVTKSNPKGEIMIESEGLRREQEVRGKREKK